MPTLAALSDAVLCAKLCEAVPIARRRSSSLRALGLRADDLARRCLALLGQRDPDAAAILGLLGVEPTARRVAALRELGFGVDDAAIDNRVRWRVQAALVAGVWSDRVIADEVGCTVEQVRGVMAIVGRAQPERCREVSDGSGTVVRRVNVVGQMTYRRRTYTVGRAYRGRTATVRECGDCIELMFGDRPTVMLVRRR